MKRILVLVLSFTAAQIVGALAAPGTLDTSFANPNVAATNFYASVWEIAIQADGKIIIGGGFESVGGQPRRSVARLNTDGTLDTSFADPNVSGGVVALAIQADGKIVIGRNFNSVGGLPRYNVARLNTDGTLDTSFVNPNVSGYFDEIAIQTDGKIALMWTSPMA